MFVSNRMSTPVITVGPDTPFPDALQLMKKHHYRRLPVVNQDGVLIGIVSERDLLHASPSPATSLSVWEMNYLLAKLNVGKLMTKEVVTVTPETPIEIAASTLVEHRIGGMPVVDDKRHVVGVITETDIFKAFVELLGTGAPGLRMMLRVPNGKGVIAKLATAIAALNGNIVSLGTFGVADDGDALLLIKVADVSQEQLVETLEALGDRVLDVREV